MLVKVLTAPPAVCKLVEETKGTNMTEDNDETTAELPQSEFIDPSPVCDELMRHYAALEPCERIPVAKSFTLPMAEYKAPMLMSLLKQISKLNRVLVLIEHEELGLFEIRRLPNGYDAAFFYHKLKAQTNALLNVGNYEESDLREKVLETLKASLVLSNEATATYDANFSLQMKNENAVTYSYLHRKLANVAAFRKANGGATAALKKTLDTLCDEGILERVPPAYAEKAFQVTAKVYRLMKG